MKEYNPRTKKIREETFLRLEDLDLPRLRGKGIEAFIKEIAEVLRKECPGGKWVFAGVEFNSRMVFHEWREATVSEVQSEEAHLEKKRREKEREKAKIKAQAASEKKREEAQERRTLARLKAKYEKK